MRPREPEPAPPRALALDDEPRETLWAVLGNAERRGGWEPPARLRVLATLGAVNLDYREAQLAYDVNDLDVVSLLGAVRITVPADVDLEVTSSAFMGSVEQETRSHPVKRFVRRLITGAEPTPEDLEAEPRPLLRIRAVAVLGAVSIRIR